MALVEDKGLLGDCVWWVVENGKAYIADNWLRFCYVGFLPRFSLALGSINYYDLKIPCSLDYFIVEV